MPARELFSARRSDLAWGLGAGLLSVGAGVLAGFAPLVLAALFVLVAATATITARPVAVLVGVLLLRASLDGLDSLLDLGVATFAGVLGALVFAGGFLALALSGSRLPRAAITVGFLGSLALTLVSIAWSLNPAEGIRTWLHHGAFIALFFLAVAAVRSPDRFRVLVAATLASAIVPLSAGLVQLASGGTFERQGFTGIEGTFDHSNGFAFYLLVIITLAIVTLFESRRLIWRVLTGFLLALCMTAFIATYTRSAWIAVVLILALLAAFQYRQLAVVALVALVVGVVAVPSSVGLVEQRFADLSSESSNYSENSASWRAENWSRMFHFATERPFFGWGVSSYPVLAISEFGRSDPRFSPEDEDSPGVYAHNDYLRLAVEVGVPGLLLWLTALVGTCAAMWRARRIPSIRPYATAMFALMVAVIFISGVDNMQDYQAVMFYLVALCGGVVGVSSEGAEPAPEATG